MCVLNALPCLPRGRGAAQHLAVSITKGFCKPQLSYNLSGVIHSQQLTCRICNVERSDLQEFHHHLLTVHAWHTCLSVVLAMQASVKAFAKRRTTQAEGGPSSKAAKIVGDAEAAAASRSSKGGKGKGKDKTAELLEMVAIMIERNQNCISYSTCAPPALLAGFPRQSRHTGATSTGDRPG